MSVSVYNIQTHQHHSLEIFLLSPSRVTSDCRKRSQLPCSIEIQLFIQYTSVLDYDGKQEHSRERNSVSVPNLYFMLICLMMNVIIMHELQDYIQFWVMGLVTKASS